MVERGRFAETVSMERNRDLRDYALIHGYGYAKEFLNYLREKLQQQHSTTNVLLDLGCGNGKAISQAARLLSKDGVSCLALDQNLPTKKYNFVQYLEKPFEDTQLDDNSVEVILSICGLGMYAENENELFRQLLEVQRILTNSGTLSIVVDPVLFLKDYDSEITKINNRLKELEVSPDLFEERALKKELSNIKSISRYEFDSQRRSAQKIWLQSLTPGKSHIRTNIFELINEAGLTVNNRLLPRGGMMIEDEVTLLISKKAI